VLLRRLVETGHGARPAARVAGEEHTAAELLERLAAEVEDSVRAFDLRNGNTAVSERSRERLERQPLVGRLPLGTRGALPVVRVAAPAAPAEVPVEAAVETGVEASAKERPPVDVEAAVLAASAQLELGDLKTAEEIARTALSAAGRPADPADAARLHLLLSQVALREDSVEEAAELALEAAHHYDAAPGRTLDAATTRLTLAQLLARLGRDAEAATVLESALPDLLGLPDVDPDLLGEARRLLGESLERIGEHRAAAEQYLRAAELAEQHRSPGAQAWFAGSAGQALQQAGLSAEADRAYARSEELWRELGEPIRLVRATRSRAWISEDIERVRALMARAARELAEAVAAVPAGPHAEDSADARRLLVLRGELAETADQTARLLMRAAAGGTGPAEEALGFAEHAASGFAELGEQVFLDRMQAELLAAWIEADLGRPDAAEQRLRAAIGHCAERGPEDQVAAGQLDQLREALEQIAGAADGG
jgi:tetratricopeptide (TPR) repeat protein